METNSRTLFWKIIIDLSKKGKGKIEICIKITLNIKTFPRWIKISNKKYYIRKIDIKDTINIFMQEISVA